MLQQKSCTRVTLWSKRVVITCLKYQNSFSPAILYPPFKLHSKNLKTSQTGMEYLKGQFLGL